MDPVVPRMEFLQVEWEADLDCHTRSHTALSHQHEALNDDPDVYSSCITNKQNIFKSQKQTLFIFRVLWLISGLN
jgi:hypothetical protein